MIKHLKQLITRWINKKHHQLLIRLPEAKRELQYTLRKSWGRMIIKRLKQLIGSWIDEECRQLRIELAGAKRELQYTNSVNKDLKDNYNRIVEENNGYTGIDDMKEYVEALLIQDEARQQHIEALKKIVDLYQPLIRKKPVEEEEQPNQPVPLLYSRGD